MGYAILIFAWCGPGSRGWLGRTTGCRLMLTPGEAVLTPGAARHVGRLEDPRRSTAMHPPALSSTSCRPSARGRRRRLCAGAREALKGALANTKLSSEDGGGPEWRLRVAAFSRTKGLSQFRAGAAVLCCACCQRVSRLLPRVASLGNAMHESGGGSSGVYLDPPTDAGHPNWGTGDAAVGAIQWEGKRQAGVSPTLQSQVDKIWDEFNNPGLAGMPQGTFERLQSAQSPGEAAHLVNTIYERPLSPAASDAQRQQFANVSLDATPGTTGTTLTSVPPGIVHPPHTLTPPTAGAPYTPEAVAAANPAPAAPAAPTFGQAIASGDVGGMLHAALTKPPPTTDAQGNTVESKSPLQKIAGAVGDVSREETPAAPAASATDRARAGSGPGSGPRSFAIVLDDFAIGGAAVVMDVGPLRRQCGPDSARWNDVEPDGLRICLATRPILTRNSA